MKEIKTSIITVDQAIADGNYKWNKGENDIEYFGFIPGYAIGVCMEVKKFDGTIGYSSCTFVNTEDDLDHIDMSESSLAPLSIMAGCCSGNGTPTGRLVFRGYFDEVWIDEEREYGYKDASQEVLDLREKYHVVAV